VNTDLQEGRELRGVRHAQKGDDQHAATDLATIQRRTLRLLFATQIVGGIGAAIGASVGALLAAELASIGVSGLVQSAVVVGGALFAVPATEIVHRSGRRLSLASAYLVASVGSIVVVVAAVRSSLLLLLAGFFLFGGAATAGLQARYAAVDLAPASLRGRHLSLIVWATTIGAVAGPNLAAFAGATLDDYGIPTLAGPFVFSALLLGVAALLLVVLMRPDPAIVAREAAARSTEGAPRQLRVGMRAALRFVASHQSARLGVIAMAVGHLVMVGVMAMTPVHIMGFGHDAAHTLRVVGVVLSLHVAGMYAFSPLMGWLTDRFGRRPVILLGILFLLAACALAGSAKNDPMRLSVGLLFLGIGWSSTMVAGSTLLSESVTAELRTSAQGLSDVTMGLAGASASALSGLIVETWGFPMLALIAAVATTPLIVLATQKARAGGTANGVTG
jgi:MFS family permease